MFSWGLASFVITNIATSKCPNKTVILIAANWFGVLQLIEQFVIGCWKFKSYTKAKLDSASEIPLLVVAKSTLEYLEVYTPPLLIYTRLCTFVAS
ncbi:hypothetical protein BGP76_16520 [Reichenbachiella sp. MSK19-1]|nr:hypothetical protein BGP76_16520 [Reichenbachiella sp. MSK19-1]